MGTGRKQHVTTPANPWQIQAVWLFSKMPAAWQDRFLSDLSDGERKSFQRSVKKYPKGARQKIEARNITQLFSKHPFIDFFFLYASLAMAMATLVIYFDEPRMLSLVTDYTVLGILAPWTLLLLPAVKRRFLFSPLFPLQVNGSGTTYAGRLFASFVLGFTLLILFLLAIQLMEKPRPPLLLNRPIDLYVLSIAIIAPVAEEVIFRELIPSMLRSVELPMIGAHLIAAVLFSAVHEPGSVEMFSLYLLCGIVLALLRVASQTLIWPWAAHGLANAVILLA